MTSEQAGILFNGLIVFAGGILVWLGTMLSRKEKSKASPETLEIAGAVISGADAKMLAEAFGKIAVNSAALHAALDRNTESVEDIRLEMRNLANVLLIAKK